MIYDEIWIDGEPTIEELVSFKGPEEHLKVKLHFSVDYFLNNETLYSHYDPGEEWGARYDAGDYLTPPMNYTDYDEFEKMARKAYKEIEEDGGLYLYLSEGSGVEISDKKFSDEFENFLSDNNTRKLADTLAKMKVPQKFTNILYGSITNE